MTLKTISRYAQWRQRLGNFGGWIDAKGKVSWGRKSPSEVQERRHDRGSSGRNPKADTYFGNGCKTDIIRRKIEHAYISRCSLERTHTAVKSAVQLTIHIGGGNIAILSP